MNTTPLQSMLEKAEQAARLGADSLLHFYGKLEHIQHKGFKGDLVTEADVAAENAIIAFLKTHFPGYGILGEESGAINPASAWQWVIDPLDGTTNFAHGHPAFAVSIALLHKHIPLIGVIYSPLHNELFSGATGHGAYLNHKALHVSKVENLPDSLLASGFPYDRRETDDNNYKEFCRLTHATQGVRRCGSAALDLAYVAAGRVDGYWERGIKPWDIAAGIVLVREAGGLVTRYDGSPLASIEEERLLATNGLIHQALSHELLRA